MGKGKDGNKRPIPGKIKNTFNNLNNKDGIEDNRSIPGKLKDRFGDKGGKGKVNNRHLPKESSRIDVAHMERGPIKK